MTVPSPSRHVHGGHGFEKVVMTTLCPYARKAVVRTMPPLEDDEPTDAYFQRIAPEIRRYVRSAEADGTDAILTVLPVRRVGCRLEELAPVLWAWVTDIADDGLQDVADVLRAQWRLKVAGSDVFVAVFTPEFGELHSRYTPDVGCVFFMLQPDSSFHRRLPEDSNRVRESIRRQFAEAGRAYDTRRLEAERFLPPHRDEAPVAWWEGSLEEVRQ